ncbi:MAG: hypothetical protein O2780_18400 [Proteobacteria bacterium]|nr:hypothetical protein [Pseudomonadota bacterium]MDA1302533.1 hypothetical protein [Pseudomonadota bacterium]
MEVLAARCAVRKTSRHDNGVPDPGTLRAPTLTAMTAATLQSLNPDVDVWPGLGVSAFQPS